MSWYVYLINIPVPDDDDEENLAEIAAKETDKQFQRFRTRIKTEPNQVINIYLTNSFLTFKFFLITIM